jgi:cytochrome c oxidase assembly protein subunit 15
VAISPAVGRARGQARHGAAAWLFCCCGLIFLMVVVGGITRLTQSGLSITEWQPLSGVVPPLSNAQWAAEFARYKEIPQYRLVDYGMTLSHFKTIFWWEYGHRFLGRLIGVAFAVPFVYFLIRRRLSRRLILPLGLVLLLGFAQGGLGWYMVESGLVHRVSVSQYRLVAHLALALLIYGMILWIALGLVRSPDPVAGRFSNWRRAAEAAILLVSATIAAGGFTAGLHAGLVYNTFPLMDGSLVPRGYGALEPFWRNWFDNVAAVQFDHRALAVATVLFVLGLGVIGLRAALPAAARPALLALVAVVLLQAALGISTLLLVVPVPLAAAHQAGALLLLTAAINLRHVLRSPALVDAVAAAPI